jgi:hypothetical protein
MLQVDAQYRIPGRHDATWEAPRNNFMTCIRPNIGCCVSSKSPKMPFISARELKATTDVPGQKGVVMTQRSKSRST